MKPLLLFVGANPSTTDLLHHIFANRYRTAVCATADEALTYLESHAANDRPSVVLCDQTSPEDNLPVELFRGLKNDHLNESIPAIVLCSHCHTDNNTDTDNNTVSLSGFGWADQICKPFNPEDLALRVRKLLAMHP